MVLLGSGWIDWGSERFVVTANVLIKEMGIAELSIAPGTESFVVPLSLVKKLMSNDSAHSGEEAEKESELEVLTICLWFSLEPSIWKINLITDHDQGPDPRNGFNEGIGVQWQEEPLIIRPLGLALLGQVGVVSLRHQLINRCDEIH